MSAKNVLVKSLSVSGKHPLGCSFVRRNARFARNRRIVWSCIYAWIAGIMPAGRYDFYPEEDVDRVYYILNHDRDKAHPIFIGDN